MSDDPVFSLHVYRDLSNRQAGQPDDGPMAREAHERRKTALHAALDGSGFEVRNWGETDDKNPHELASLILTSIGTAVVAAGSVLGPIAYQLLLDALKDAARDSIKNALVGLTERLISYMRAKPKAVQDFWINAPNGMMIRVDPDERIVVRLASGETKTFDTKAKT